MCLTYYRCIVEFLGVKKFYDKNYYLYCYHIGLAAVISCPYHVGNFLTSVGVSVVACPRVSCEPSSHSEVFCLEPCTGAPFHSGEKPKDSQ